RRRSSRSPGHRSRDRAASSRRTARASSSLCGCRSRSRTTPCAWPRAPSTSAIPSPPDVFDWTFSDQTGATRKTHRSADVESHEARSAADGYPDVTEGERRGERVLADPPGAHDLVAGRVDPDDRPLAHDRDEDAAVTREGRVPGMEAHLHSRG